MTKEGTFGLTIRRIGLKPGPESGGIAEATLIGMPIHEAQDLIPHLGQEVSLKTAGGRSQVGILRQMVFTAGKDDKPTRVQLKVSGSRGIDAMIDVGVTVESRQLSLLEKAGVHPTVAASATTETTPCRECGHGWNTRGKKKKPNGHRRETGRCFCGCQEMKL